MTEKAPEFWREGLDENELAESYLRHNAREARRWDSEETAVVTRQLLLTGADAIYRLRDVNERLRRRAELAESELEALDRSHRDLAKRLAKSVPAHQEQT